MASPKAHRTATISRASSSRRSIRVVLSALMAIGAGACRREAVARPTTSPPAPARPVGWRYPNEQSWLVGETLGAIAGLAHYARTRTVADPTAIDFQVQDTHLASADKAVFRVQRRDGQGEPFMLEVTDSIFSTPSFAGPAAKWLGDLKASAPASTRRLPDRLLDLRLENLYAAQDEVSDALTKDPLSSEAHEDAAFVIAAFGLREAAAGHTDPRRLLVRATAHQAIAAALRGSAAPGTVGRLAQTASAALAGRTAEAAERSAAGIGSALPAERAWSRALHLFATQDWRELSWDSRLSLLERIAWFKAFRVRNGSDHAYSLLETLSPDVQALPDWGRIRLTGDPSVRDCNEFAVGGLAYDLNEAMEASTLFRGKPLDPSELVTALNVDSPVSPVVTVDGVARVEVLDWGAAAAFAQRHMGMRMSYEAACYERTFGIAERTAQSIEMQRQLFAGLTLFPLEAHRWMKSAEPYKRDAEAAVRLVKTRPEIVTPHLWERLLENPTFAPPPDAPSETVWFDPALPLGTHFWAGALYGPFRKRHTTHAVYEAIIRIDPFDTETRATYTQERFGRTPPYERMLENYGPALEWDLRSMTYIASLAPPKSAQRRQWLTRACAADADHCNHLATFLVDTGDEPAAAEAFRRWWKEGEDRVTVANGVDWLVKYDRTHGREAEAWEVARDAASTYSARGLSTLASLAEETGRLQEAEGTFRKEAARYDNADVVYEFYNRQVAKGNKRFAAPREALFQKVFPGGVETLTSTPTDKPSDGVQLTNLDATATAAGFHPDDIAVALDGVRVHSRAQWRVLNARGTRPDMRVLVYRGGAYIEVRCHFEDRKIPAYVGEYPPRR